MHLIVKGDPVTGFSFTGPFQTEDDAMSWAMIEYDHESDWWPAEMEHPDKTFNDEPVECSQCGTSQTCDDCKDQGNVVIITGKELEEMLKNQGKSNLPRQVMMDLSELPVGAEA